MCTAPDGARLAHAHIQSMAGVLLGYLARKEPGPTRQLWWTYDNCLQPYGGPGGVRGSFYSDVMPFQGNRGIQTCTCRGKGAHTSTGPARENLHRVRGRELFKYQHGHHARTPTKAVVEQQVESGTPLPGVVWAVGNTCSPIPSVAGRSCVGL